MMWGEEELANPEGLLLSDYEDCDILTPETARDIKNNNDKLRQE
jgi:hypothetical protein